MLDMKTANGRPAKIERSALGQRIAALREAANLSQREVAAGLGIAQPSYAAWERRNVALTHDQLKKLAQILGVQVADFFSESDQPARRNGPVGRARKTFEAISALPRSRQKQLLDVVDILMVKPANGQS
jgi:transcriptional regulator with XRE-family HTH domain